MINSPFEPSPFFPSSPMTLPARRFGPMSSRTFSLLVGMLAWIVTPTFCSADQFLLFDVTFTFTKDDADHSTPSKSHYYVKGDKLNPARPIDWTAPVDYR